MANPAIRAAILCVCAGMAAPALAGVADETPAPAPVLVPTPAPAADGRQHLGTVRIFTNDWFGVPFGDRYDRWRTGSVQVSILHGDPWGDVLPANPFAVMEYRFRGEIVAPDNLAAPATGDRLYAGSWSLGASTHFGWRGFDISFGGDVVMVGPQTGMMALHSWIHEGFGNDPIDLAAFEVEDGLYLHGAVEIARDLPLSWGGVRPFIELQAGVETLARAGLDVTIGPLGAGGLRLRDPVSGHRLAGINAGDVPGGWSFLFGADSAWVAASVLLPEDSGPAPTDQRHRLRAGANYAVGDSNFFYGVSYLSEEFEGQPEGQVVGVLSVDVRF